MLKLSVNANEIMLLLYFRMHIYTNNNKKIIIRY